MAEAYFSNLSPAELERLALLMEEAAEVQQIIGKIIRHGYESKNPLNDSGTTNRELLEMELGHLEFVIQLMYDTNDILPNCVAKSRVAKSENVQKYLHHTRGLEVVKE